MEPALDEVGLVDHGARRHPVMGERSMAEGDHTGARLTSVFLS
jgi:hypothetical protein